MLPRAFPRITTLQDLKRWAMDQELAGVNGRLMELLKQQQAILRDLLAELDGLQARCAGQIGELEGQLARLEGWSTDPPVLVRVTRGGRHRVYHHALRPCGWVRTRHHYREMLLGEARAQGMRPCTSCGWAAQPPGPRP